MCIKAREGWVAFEEVNVDNKKAISALDFWNGYFSKNCDREEKYFVAKTSSESWHKCFK